MYSGAPHFDWLPCASAVAIGFFLFADGLFVDAESVGMTSGTSSPTPTDSPSLSQRPLLTTGTNQHTRKTVEFEPEMGNKADRDHDKDRDPERYQKSDAILKELPRRHRTT